MDKKEFVYVANWSGGKDSTAQLIEIKRRGMPLDYVIHADIMFDEKTSGEHPLMAEWLPKAEKILKDNFNIEIIHLPVETNYYNQFYRKKQRGKHIGDNYGFAHRKSNWCNSLLKMKPINKFIKTLVGGYSVVEYVGIASDEPSRLERYAQSATEDHCYITLNDMGISENEAMDVCRQHNLLSPKYEKSFRSGCWFCHNQTNADLYDLWKNYPTYFARLEEMEKDSHNVLKGNKSLYQIRRLFEMGKIPKNRKAKNKFKQLSMFD